ncbi:hypothetical protein EVAR_97830_1 [Eumeta japonica]|uniref:Uncharacterized protein n=1 Tax=Eumeta variegata TaxID=151549 RepID=A0A4C1SM84_EUMVA|nr:hypothetical protein EVAR_97830_1 [Eumeta japonica]
MNFPGSDGEPRWRLQFSTSFQKQWAAENPSLSLIFTTTQPRYAVCQLRSTDRLSLNYKHTDRGNYIAFNHMVELDPYYLVTFGDPPTAFTLSTLVWLYCLLYSVSNASNAGRPDGTIAGGRARSASPHDRRGQCPHETMPWSEPKAHALASLTGCRDPVTDDRTIPLAVL